MSDLLGLLGQNVVFSGLDDESRNNLVRNAIPRRFTKGEIITHRGDVWPYLFLIAEGEVSALKESSEGRSLIVATFTSGEIFWGLAFFEENEEMPVTLTAGAATTIHLWSRESLQPVLFQHGHVSWELCRLMIRRMMRASDILEEMAFQSVSGRLARLLVENFSSSDDHTIERSLTLDEMAARVGTTREMVCRALYRFADQKIIEVTRTEFILTDKSKLKNMAGSL